MNHQEIVENILKEYTTRKELPSYDDCAKYFYYIIDAIGDLCNLLKNRPWAQSNYLVSMYDFDERVKKLWIIFWNVIGWLGINKEQLFEMFERKYLVNVWRIQTGY